MTQSLNVHLLISVFVTDKSLSTAKFYGVQSSDQNKFNQTLSMLHSFSKLEADSQDIRVTLDEPYDTPWHWNLLIEFVRLHFPSAKFSKQRLETFDMWRDAARSIPNQAQYVLLNTNHDHVYLHQNGAIIRNALRNSQALGARLTSVSHWAEAVSRAKRHRVDGRFYGLIQSVSWVIGTCAVETEFFKSWWEKDFTHGQRIVRPDNPFGPWVKFDVEEMYVPPEELIRHLDGYGHASIYSPKSWTLVPCCKIDADLVSHNHWTSGTWREVESGQANLPSIEIVEHSKTFSDVKDYLMSVNAIAIRPLISFSLLSSKGVTAARSTFFVLILASSKFGFNRMFSGLFVQFPKEVTSRAMFQIGKIILRLRKISPN